MKGASSWPARRGILSSVPICGDFDGPSVVADVMNTFSPVTIGDDHPRPGISTDHSTFSVFPYVSASRAFVLTGFEAGPRNCGQAASSPPTSPVATITAQARPIRLVRVLEGVPTGVFVV